MMRRQTRGFSLVELLVALTIGLFLVSGILYIYLSTRSSYSTNDAAARVQEDARFAMERLTRDVRMAGYMGCTNTLDITPNVIANALQGTGMGFLLGDGIRIYPDGAGWTNPTSSPVITRVAGTDVITLKGVGQCSARLRGNMTADNANIQIDTNPCNWVAGNVLVISDCTSADIFQATNVSSGNVTIAHAQSSNTDNKLSKAYGTDALVWQYSETTYFIGLHPTIGQPMLYQIASNGVARAVSDVVGNVYGMQFVANLDTDGDGDVDSAGTLPGAVVSWSQVASVGLAFDVRSEDAISGSGASSYTFNGGTVTDKRIRRSYSTTIGIRNRLP
jgi:type IV pilus assembly protein PilW